MNISIPLVAHFIIFVILLNFVILALCNKHLPKWFCDKIGWHLAPGMQGFDGCSFTGKCPRCGKGVLQDSQGNWF